VSQSANSHFTSQILAGQLDIEDGPVFGWNPNQRSPAGAIGPCQFMPGTWQQWGRGGDPTSPSDCIPAMVRYDDYLYGYCHSVDGALEAYNSGSCSGAYSYASNIESLAHSCPAHSGGGTGGQHQAQSSHRQRSSGHPRAYISCQSLGRHESRCLTWQHKWIKLKEVHGKWYGDGPGLSG
jgi:hypothetical protein